MNIHEYQAKQLLATFNLPVSEGIVVHSVDEASQAFTQLNTNFCVVKAQIHAGGRGKAGGVVLCRSEGEVKNAVEKLINTPLVTYQTGPDGQIIRKIYVEKASTIDKEFYLSFVLNRKTSQITIIASAEGGVDIEAVAENTPEKIIKLSINSSLGLMPYHVRVLCESFQLDKEHAKQLFSMLKKIYQAFIEKDVSLLEINPLILTQEGNLNILDAKMSFDDNALFKHKDIENLRDEHEEDQAELKAKEYDLNYIKLDGNIGCMVNGAGLAMATMDIVQMHGGKPANFLDVGGGATKERVKAAFQIILSDKDVKGIFVNIFGGIMRCDIIAQGIVDAAKETSISIPLIVRLQGTNMIEGQKILKESELEIMSINDLDEAAKKIVSSAS